MSVLTQNLATRPTGPYAMEHCREDFPGVTWNDGLDQGRAEIIETAGDPAHGRALRVHYPAGAVGPQRGGAQFLAPLSSSFERLVVSYRIRFGQGFDFVLGGKLPGLVGGDANTGGNRPTGNDGFSARLMWRPAGAVVSYVYHPDQQGIYGDDFPWDLGGARYFIPGIWHRVEQEVVMNTGAERDGSIRAWFDGQPALALSGIRFRNSGAFAIDAFYFSTFFGGNDPCWAPRRDQHVDFAEMVVAAERSPS